jgi:hypothetical protein
MPSECWVKFIQQDVVDAAVEAATPQQAAEKPSPISFGRITNSARNRQAADIPQAIILLF